MLAMKVIELAETEWADRILFAPKKDGSLILCMHSQRVNAVTERSSYPYLERTSVSSFEPSSTC